MTYSNPEILTEKEIADLLWGANKPKNWFKLILWRKNHNNMPGRRTGNGRYLAPADDFKRWLLYK